VGSVAVRPRTLTALLIGAALLGAGARGLLTGANPRPAPAAAPTSVVGSRTDDHGLEVGFAHTRAGAVAAATSDVRQGQRLYDLPTALRSSALQGMAAQSAADAYVADETQRLTELDGVAARGRGPLTWDVAVLAWRLDAYAPDRARVSVWRVGVLSVDGLTNPLAEWTTVAYDLVWERGDWRIWSETQTPGPTPKVHPADSPSTPEQLRTALAGFTRYPGPDPVF
jgi:hypothetical protein